MFERTQVDYQNISSCVAGFDTNLGIFSSRINAGQECRETFILAIRQPNRGIPGGDVNAGRKFYFVAGGFHHFNQFGRIRRHIALRAVAQNGIPFCPDCLVV